MLGRFYLVGILIGLTAGTIATVVGGGLAGFFLGLVGVDFGQDLSENTPFALALLVVASIGFIATGHTTARYSPGHAILNAGAAGFLLVIISAASVADAGIALFPFWLDIALILLPVPLALIGARWGMGRWRDT